MCCTSHIQRADSLTDDVREAARSTQGQLRVRVRVRVRVLYHQLS